MNILKREYSLSLTASYKYNSVKVTEGFEVQIDESFNELEWESKKQELKDKLTEETRQMLAQWNEELDIDVTL